MHKECMIYGTYLINLDRSFERLKFMEKEFQKQNMHFQRISSIDGTKLKGNEFIVKNRYDRNLVPGEIGCYLSHIKTLQIFLESDNCYALIIEDDAQLCEDFKNIIEKFIEKHSVNTSKNSDWDVLKLRNGKRRHIKIENVYKKYFLAACGTSIPITTLAAIWTRKGAEKFLKKVVNPLPIVKRPIDCDLQHPWEFGMRIYNVLPSPVESANFATQIQLVNKLRKSNLSRQIIYEINRFFPKYFYIINHHGWRPFYDSFIAKKNKKIS